MTLKNFKMNLTKIRKIYNHKFLWASFLIPTLCFLIYFASHSFNFMTVDLGQQYIDFLAYFQQNALSHPLRLIYSFSNGLGGSMIGTNAYYLASPFNLLLLLFPQKYLVLGVLVIIALKIGTAGASSFYYWQKKFKLSGAYLLAAACAYALCGFVVANYLNLMWLDSVILLPLLLDQIDHLFQDKKSHLILITFLCWLSNFYTGYMVLLFGFCYFIKELFLEDLGKKRTALAIRYFKLSIFGSLLCSFVLLPTFFELIGGKASSQSIWNFKWQFPLYQAALKLMVGSYNYHEMEAGMPNIFIPMSLLLGGIAFFLSNFSKKQKVANGILLVFLILSLSFNPLVLIWHMGQFPIWYPGRFSFILSFFLLELSLFFLEKGVLSNFGKIFLMAIAIGLGIFWLANQHHIAFINQTSLIISGLFLLSALLFILLVHNNHGLAEHYLLLTVIVEITCNLFLSLNNITFQNNTDYLNFSNNLHDVTTSLTNDFSRIEKTFSRSDDDPFTANYHGISVFNSISNQKVTTLLSNLGYLHNSNSVTNNGGTPITDAILGIKYYLEPNYAHDRIKPELKMQFNNLNNSIDLENYLIHKEYSQLLLLKNPSATPLIYLTQGSLQVPDFDPANPLTNQQLLLNQITDTNLPVIASTFLPNPEETGVDHQSKSIMAFHKQQNATISRIRFTINIPNDNDFYLQLPAGINTDSASLFINNRQINLDDRDAQAHLINLASHQRGTQMIISFVMHHETIDLSELKLWQIDIRALNQRLTDFNSQQPKIHQLGDLSLISNPFVTKSAVNLASSIPYSKNWLIYDLKQNKLLTISPAYHAFLGTNLQEGKHQLLLIYLPFTFLIGILASLFTLLFIKLHNRVD